MLFDNTLFIKRLDQSRLALDGSENIVNEVSNQFSFYAPGFQYDRRFRNHMWDGKIRLINQRTGIGPVGLYDRIAKYCRQQNIELVDCTEDTTLEKVVDDLSNVDQWIQSLHLPFTPYEYQINAFKKAIGENKQILVSPTGSGKSLIIYLIIRWCHQFKRKCCLIVPSTSLVEQMYNDFKNYSVDDDSFNVDKIVDKLYNNSKCDPFKSEILISTWQSVVKFDSSFCKRWDCVLVDECHNAKSKSLQTIMSGCDKAQFKFGLTGSLTGETMHEFVLVGSFGEVYQVATTAQLQASGQLSPLTLYMLMLKYPADQSKVLWEKAKQIKSKKNYDDEIEFITNHGKRQLFIRNLACSLKGTVLILFRTRAHGKILYDIINQYIGDKRPVFHIDGNIKPKEREKIRQASIEGKDAIIIASVGTSATGLNIPCIENVILSPSKSRVQNIQAIGRGIRLYQGKQHCTVFDIVDDLSVGRHKNYCIKHGMERYQIYQEQGFDVQFKNIEI